MKLTVKDKIGWFLHNRFRENEAKLHELTYLFWECTLRCNLSCLHCGSDCTSNSSLPDMPFEDFINTVESLITEESRSKIIVVITGGEPLLRNDLAECGKELIRRGFNWGIVTNGYAYTERKHEELIDAGLSSITVSLDGLEETHNWLRNSPHSFSRAMSAIRLIKNTPNLIYDVVTCVNRRNINELTELKKLFVDEGIAAWRLFTIAPIGRARSNPELQLTSSQFTQLMDFIEGSREEHSIDIKFSCEGFVGRYESKVRDSFFFCRAGINIASVLIDGSISACPNIDRSFVQGNIYKDNFIDVWESKFSIMRERNWTKAGKCSDCADYKYCKGNGMHLWDKDRQNVVQCHKELIK